MSEQLQPANVIPMPKVRRRGLWQKTRHANLVRYKPSGVYYVKAHVNGRSIHESLNTADMGIAVQKRDKRLAEERAKTAARLDENVTVGELVAEYLAAVNADPKAKPRAKEYRAETVKILDETWPELRSVKVASLTQAMIEPWADRLMEQYSPTRYNGTLQTLRGILQIAVDRRLLLENPARTRKRHSRAGIPNAQVEVSAKEIPDEEQWNRLMAMLDAHPRRLWSARFVRFLAFTGARIGAVQLMTPRDVDLARNVVYLPPIKHTMRPTVVPILPELRPVLEAILRDHPGDGSPLFPIKSPKRTLDTLGALIGIKLTPHIFRHIFTSHMLAAGVPVPTVAQWRGDRDGGAMLLKVYSHQIDSKSQEFARAITFSANTTTEPKEVSYDI